MDSTPSAAELLELQRQSVLGTYPPADIMLTRGSMSWVWDITGRRYLDFEIGRAHV